MALSGMTGFARREGAQGAWTWSVEARSVNGRGLDVRFRGPSGLDGLERAARDGAQSQFQRGQITVGLQARRADSQGQVRINTDQLERYLEIARPYVASGSAAPPAIDGLMALRGVVEVSEDQDDEETRTALEGAMALTIRGALEDLRAARLEEGAALEPVLAGQIAAIETLVAQADALAGEQPAYIRQRFERRLAELIDDPSPLEDRIVQEAAIMAGKADVREELDRLTTHVEAARTLLGGEQTAGRRLDFLSQEFMREANTLCSKSATTGLTAVGLELKAVIEQFREQVQNVE